MKNLVLTLIALTVLSTSNVFAFQTAHSPDKEYAAFTCEQTDVTPDNMIDLAVIQGGVIGMTRIELHRSSIVGPQTRTYIVRQLPLTKKRDVLTYTGKNIKLAISLVSEDAEGNRPSILTLTSGANAYNVDMNCVQHLRHF